MGAIEVTRLGMGAAEMETIADFMGRVLVERQSPEVVGEEVIEFREGFQRLYYNFDDGLPPVR
jgi:glycine/serine hydroxymethyltransferase